MSKLFSFSWLAAIVMSMLCWTPALAGVDPPVIKVLDGSLGQIKDSAAITVEDAKFFDAGYTSILNTPYPIQNVVSFEFNEGLPVYLQSAFTATVVVRVTTTAANSSTSSVDKTLTLTYDPSAPYYHRATYVFANSYRTEVKIISVTKNVAWNVWSALKIVNQLQAFPQYKFYRNNAVGQLNDSAFAANSFHDDLPVWWTPSVGADEYDLEWTYIDKEALDSGRYTKSGSFDQGLIFENNASRVSITGTTYRVPLLYDSKGTLFYRVRAVQWQTGGGRNEAVWTTFNTAGHGQFAFDGHQDSLNWQATTSFAEEGKRKSVVQYYDGSLRGRQTVTKDNTVNRTIVAESFYDYQGRPVIQALPAPTLNTVLGYTKGFNRGFNSTEYDKNQFDSLANPGLYCSLQASPMDTASGASQYYSSNSVFRDSGVHKYVPNAEQFPFTETEYTQDNTGRINRQGGVGNDFRLGSGHETKYLYSTPDQRELDALFGTEVGDVSHYFKNSVRDANGQYSISYVDMRGRTIATALAGTPPDSIKLATLASNNAAVRTEVISSPASVVIKDLVMEHQKSLAVYAPANHTFFYSLNPQILKEEGCSMDSVCYDCLYDLQITITDDCNNQKLGGKAFDTVFHNFSLNAIDTTCNAGTGFNITFNKFLLEGNYEITKKLSVSRSGMNYLRDSVFMLKNTCKTLDSFVVAQRALLAQVTECKPTCKSCTDSLGTWTQYWERFRSKNGIPNVDTAVYKNMALEAYATAQQECAELCAPVNESNSIRKTMLMDMTPSSGQYANIDNEKDKYNIFYSRLDSSAENRIQDTFAIYTQINTYKDADGNADMVFDESAGKLVPPQALTPEVFAQRFQTSWAEALLPKHPEYCKLFNYEKLNLSHDWDKTFEATDTYAEARQKGYLNPIDLNTTPPFNLFNGSGTYTPDPLRSLEGSIFQNKLKDSIEHYRNVSGYGYISMWQMACVAVMCKGTSGTACYDLYKVTTGHPFDPAYMCTGELDMAWRLYRQFYLDIKRNMINAWIKSQCLSSMTTAQILASGHQPNFSDAQELISLQSPADLPSTKEEAEAIKQQYYASNCKAYVGLWLKEFATCTQYDTAALNQVIIPALIDICREGADSTHPYGSSSVRPASTRSFRSFEAWISNYNATHSITDLVNCNPYKLSAPKPYDQQAMNGNKPLYSKPDDCECTNVSRLYSLYKPKAAKYNNSFSKYLDQVYQTRVTDSVLTLLLKLCGNADFAAADCDYVSQPISLPPVFQCNTNDVCVDCAKFSALDAEFKALYPAKQPNVADSALDDSVQLATNKLYEQFMNYRLGYSKTVDDYVNFKAQCAVASSAASSLQALADGYRKSLTASTSWLLQGTNFTTVTDQHAIMDSGYLKEPAGYGSTPGYANPLVQLSFNRYVCLPQGYEVEYRIKSPNTNLVSLSMLTGDTSGTGGFYTHFVSDMGSPSQIAVAELQDGKSVPLSVAGGSSVSGSLHDWHVYKVRVSPTDYKLYVDGQLLLTRAKPAGMYGRPLNRLTALYSMLGGWGYKVDWVKVADLQGIIQYYEEFTDPGNTAIVNGSAICPADTCTTGFANYFNQQRGTSYTFSQISSLYTAQGINLDVCGNNQLNCDTLRNIVADFKAARQYGYAPRIQYGVYDGPLYSDLHQLAVNGVMQLPDTARQRTLQWYQVMQVDARAGSFCWGDGYAMEARMKYLELSAAPTGNNGGDLFYVTTGNLNCVFGRYSNGILLTRVEDNHGNQYGAGYGLFNTIVADSDPDAIGRWFTVKLEVNFSHYYIYFNGRLIIDIPRNSALPITYGANFTIAHLSLQAAADWFKLYDKNGQVKYFEDFTDPDNPVLPDRDYICPNPIVDCQTSFADYFNLQRGTSYTFRQLDSLYYNTCGQYLNVCEDSTPDCNKLNNLLTDYNKQYVNPDSRIVDLPMRTFAGNRTPAEGPKGVFDVNGTLLGKTTDGTPAQINASFATIWNSSLANQQVGTIAALPDGLFRLQLKPGQEAPCSGLVGMRYYQFEVHTKDSVRSFQTGKGSYVDFGDNTFLKAEQQLWNNKNRVIIHQHFGYYLTTRFVMGDDYLPHSFFQLWHYYTPSAQRKTYTATVYHTDTLGCVAFNDWGAMGDSTMFSNLRGYFPQNMWYFGMYGTRDSTINRTNQISNFNQINSIEWVELMANTRPGADYGIYLQNNLGNFSNNHNLKRLRIDAGYSLIPNYQLPGVVDAAAGGYFHDNFPDLPANFRDLRLIIFNGWTKRESDLYQFSFEIPKLRKLSNAYTDLYNGYNDTVYNQLARAAIRDSGVVYLGASATSFPAGSASTAARNHLINDKHWLLYPDQPGSPADYPIVYNIIVDDSLVTASPFAEFINQKLGTHLSYQQIRELYNTCNNKLDDCNKPANRSDLTLCGRAQPNFPVTALEAIDNCSDSTFFIQSKAQDLYARYTDSVKGHFDSSYRAKCMQAYKYERFTVRHTVSEYHYTLYYYDQGGNLVKTIPPAGVRANYDSLWLDTVRIARLAGQVKLPAHVLPTQYRYNTLNQVIAQKSPDGGKTEFWYDRLGRLSLSRNARQLGMSSAGSRYFSYTKYDVLGRITEVGQVRDTATRTIDDAFTRNEGQLSTWQTNHLNFRGQVTNTVYDEVYNFGGLTPRLVTAQQNVRNRVSYVTYTDTTGASSAYANASFYSYDIHGNVDTLLQDYGNSAYVPNLMNKNGNRFKKFVYEYDLISGKVNKVTYQPGFNDQWIHRYFYDAENRLTEVETSADGYSWEREAKYDYYLHGPLARTTLGQQQVQGIDYAYTLQGWLKGINSTGGTATHDIGGDGKSGSINQYTATDALGLNLNYFGGDYKPIKPGVTPFPAYRVPGTALHDSAYRPLYNGNISSMTLYNDRLEAANSGGGILYAYQYDQLNRLVKQDAFAGFNRGSNTYGDLTTYGSTFRETISYDANGNIQTYNRNAGGFGSEMDQLTYHYYDSSNKLKRVNDAIAANKYGSGSNDLIVDIDDQTDSSNYVYDEIGNLILDKSEGNTHIKWNVYGKITEVTRTPSTKAPYSKMSYSYDAAGNRISKVTTRNDGRMDYTWYVRDAQGNLITSYTAKDESGTNKDSLQKLFLAYGEQYIYGSSRVGARNNLLGVGVDGEPYDYWFYGYSGAAFQRGARQYELTNHLGNVLATISDRKFGVPLNDTAVSYYQPDITSANDYYPFGMPSRVSLSNAPLEGQYRYGFNGKENDWQGKGWMNQQDYGLRIYDPRLGRFLSVDPLTTGYPMLTPYQFASNTPIWAIDLDGAEAKPTTVGSVEAQTATTKERKFFPKGNIEVVTTWLWHTGGLSGRSSVVNGKTVAGWYTVEGYNEMLANTNAAAALAVDVKLVDDIKVSAPRQIAGMADLKKFVGGGLNANATSYLFRAAKNAADAANLYNAGIAEVSSFNAEDIVGLGLLMKGAFRLIAGKLESAATARTLKSWGVVEEIKVVPVLVTTSAEGTAPSFVYTIYEGDGTLFKFGVSNADGVRLAEELKRAGPGAYFNSTGIMQKSEAHVYEKYLRSLHYASTRQYALPGMKYPFPINFETGKAIRSVKK